MVSIQYSEFDNAKGILLLYIHAIIHIMLNDVIENNEYESLTGWITSYIDINIISFMCHCFGILI